MAPCVDLAALIQDSPALPVSLAGMLSSRSESTRNPVGLFPTSLSDVERSNRRTNGRPIASELQSTAFKSPPEYHTPILISPTQLLPSRSPSETQIHDLASKVQQHGRSHVIGRYPAPQVRHPRCAHRGWSSEGGLLYYHFPAKRKHARRVEQGSVLFKGEIGPVGVIKRRSMDKLDVW